MEDQRQLRLASPEKWLEWIQDYPSEAAPVDGPSGVSNASVSHPLPLDSSSPPQLVNFYYTHLPSTNSQHSPTNIPRSLPYAIPHGQPYTQQAHCSYGPLVQESTDSLAINTQTKGQSLQRHQQTPEDSKPTEEMLWKIMPASTVSPRRTPLFTKGRSFEEQEVPERPSSSICEPILSDQEYTGDEIEHQTLVQRQDEGKRNGRSSQKRITNAMDAGDHYSIEGKRPRKSYQLQKKLQIIEYWKENPQSYSKIAKHFQVPRTTVYGIIKDKAILQQLAKSSPQPGLTLETSRMVTLHFAVLEELLMAWILDLKSRGIPVSGHRITTQAFEIHRVLSGLLLNPLPPCQFSSGWLKNFKNRRQISLREMDSKNTNANDTARAFKESHAKLDGFNMRNIYWCDISNMFLGEIPTRTFQSGTQEYHKSAMDTASVSVLLCSNVASHREVKPLVLVRHGPGVFEIDGYGDMVVDAGVEDLTTSVLKDWLTRFEKEHVLAVKVALLVDEAVWRLLEVDPCESTYTTGGVTVIKVPRELSALMPLRNGIAKELKAKYHVLAMEARKAAVDRSWGVARSSDVAFEDYLKLVPVAWSEVSNWTLNRSFERFLPPTKHPPTKHQPVDGRNLPDVESAQGRLKEMLQNVSPAIPHCIIEYHLHHDRDIGPSSFLRVKIQEMQRHPDYEEYFGEFGFGAVRVARPTGKSPGFNTFLQRVHTTPLTFSGRVLVPSQRWNSMSKLNFDNAGGTAMKRL